MAVINGKQIGTGVWEIKCCYCLKRVALMTGEELPDFLIWLTTQAEIVSCFECDPIGADTTPFTEAMTALGKRQECTKTLV